MREDSPETWPDVNKRDPRRDKLYVTKKTYFESGKMQQHSFLTKLQFHDFLMNKIFKCQSIRQRSMNRGCFKEPSFGGHGLRKMMRYLLRVYKPLLNWAERRIQRNDNHSLFLLGVVGKAFHHHFAIDGDLLRPCMTSSVRYLNVHLV